jgi:hypothetical protein
MYTETPKVLNTRRLVNSGMGIMWKGRNAILMEYPSVCPGRTEGTHEKYQP